MRIFDLVTEPTEEIKMRIENVINGIDNHFQTSHKLANGETREVDVYITSISIGTEDVLYSIIIDVTEKRNLLNEVIKKNKELEELNKTKDKFFNIIAHDLKNSFNTILAFSEMLSDDNFNKQEEFFKTLVTIINSASWQAFKLLENLLEWSRAQTGRINFEPSQIILKDILTETIGLLSSTSKQKEIKIENFVPKNCEIFADRNMLTTIIRNLINNAIKYTKRGGVIQINASDNDREVEISVQDNGIGMNRETLSKLFRIDERNSKLGTEREGGTGIGLILCKEFVEKHQGKIWAESEINKGSKFIFTIPKL